MTQQVVLARVILPIHVATQRKPNMDFVFEQKGTDTDLHLSTVKPKITDFFNTTASGATKAVAWYLGYELRSGVSNAAEIEYYDITAHLDGSAHGSPIQIDQWTLGNSASSQNSLPEQVSCVCHYRSAYGTDMEFGTGTRPRSRHRGRFYLGPLNSLVMNTDGSNGQFVFADQFKTDLTASLSALNTATGTSDIPQLVQWSRKNAAVHDILFQSFDLVPGVRRRRRPIQAFIG